MILGIDVPTPEYLINIQARFFRFFFRWFNFPPAHTLIFSTCTIIGNYIHTYKANIANIQTARLFVPARLLRTQGYEDIFIGDSKSIHR